MRWHCLPPALAVYAFSRLAHAQLSGGSPGVSISDSPLNGSQLCDATFADVNATGVFTINPSALKSGPVSYAATVYDPATPNIDAQLSLWFTTNGANYGNNYGLGYDVCYFWLSQPTINTFERGQNDTGDCTTMFSDRCVADFKALTTNLTIAAVGDPTGLNFNSLPSVCAGIASRIESRFPSSCNVFFNETIRTATGGPPSLGGALTGNQSLLTHSACTTFNANATSTSPSSATYTLLWSQYGQADLLNYYLANYFIAPLLTVWMPIADAARPVTLSYVQTEMTCVRARNLNSGSAAVPAAPSPTPVNEGAYGDGGGKGGLSSGAIAGIVIAIVLILGLAGVAFFMRRRIQMWWAQRKGRGVSKRGDIDGGARGARGEQHGAYAELDNMRSTRHEAPAGMETAELEDRRMHYAELDSWKADDKTGRERLAVVELDSTPVEHKRFSYQ